MRYLTLALYAEGETDHEFFRPLLVRVVADTCMRRGLDIVEVQDSFIRLPRMLPGGSPREDRIEAAVDAAAEAVSVVFLHTDGNGDRKRALETRIEPARVRIRNSHPNIGVVPLVPTRETEAWALADKEVLAQCLGVQKLQVRISRVERLQDPKALLQSTARERGESDFRGLLGMLGQRIRFSELRKLKSYREFEKCVEEELERLAIIN